MSNARPEKMLPNAVFPVSVFPVDGPDQPATMIPFSKAVTLQFLTVTPVVPSSRIP